MTPAIRALYQYWSCRKGDGIAPSWGDSSGGDFKLVELDADVLPLLAVVDVAGRPRDYVYRYWGTQRGEILNTSDATGKTVGGSLVKSTVDRVVQQYREVVEAKVPLLVLNFFELRNGLVAELQTLRLPLSTDGETVDKVVSATAFLRHQEEFLREVSAEAGST